jgi:hypothetical protein
VVSKCCAERTCPLEMREAAQRALPQVTLSRRGLGAALRHALSVCAEGGDAAVVPAVWEEMMAQVAAGGVACGDLTAVSRWPLGRGRRRRRLQRATRVPIAELELPPPRP